MRERKPTLDILLIEINKRPILSSSSLPVLPVLVQAIATVTLTSFNQFLPPQCSQGDGFQKEICSFLPAYTL